MGTWLYNRSENRGWQIKIDESQAEKVQERTGKKRTPEKIKEKSKQTKLQDTGIMGKTEEKF